MEPSRAAWLLDNPSEFYWLRFAFEAPIRQTPIDPLGLTEAEDNYIRMVWSIMDETTSYHDALVAIAGR